VTDGTGPGAEIWRKAEVSARMITWAVLRIVASIVVVTAVYYLLPFDQSSTGVAVTLLVAGLVVFVGLVAFQARAIIVSPFPGLRAIEALATSVPLFLALFASTYFVIARLSPGSFTAPLTRTDSLYFTVTVFSTVGFGDITAKTEAARLVVTGQMIADLVILGFAIKAIVGAVRRGRQRQPQDADHAQRALLPQLFYPSLGDAASGCACWGRDRRGRPASRGPGAAFAACTCLMWCGKRPLTSRGAWRCRDGEAGD
jgi:Ion channel